MRPHSAPWGGKRCACDGASQVVIRIPMAARKMRAGEAEDGLHLNGGPALPEQFSGDPKIDDAPIRLREALPDMPSLHTTLVDRDGLLGTGWAIIGDCGERHGWRLCRLPDRLQQRFAARRQTRTSVDNSYPRGVAVQGASCRFLIGESGEPTQVAPVGAGRIAAVEVCQVPAGRGRYRRLQRRGAKANPSLQMAGAGLQHHTRIMSVGAHAVHHCGIGAIQIDENIACVSVAGVGVNVDVTPLAVASTQKADRRGSRQLSRRPEPLSGKRTTSPIVNQTDQIEIVRHGGQLSANGLPGQEKTTLFHDRNFAVGIHRRTMNFQRTANSVLTVCLSRGGRSKRMPPPVQGNPSTGSNDHLKSGRRSASRGDRPATGLRSWTNC